MEFTLILLCTIQVSIYWQWGCIGWSSWCLRIKQSCDHENTAYCHPYSCYYSSVRISINDFSPIIVQFSPTICLFLSPFHGRYFNSTHCTCTHYFHFDSRWQTSVCIQLRTMKLLYNNFLSTIISFQQEYYYYMLTWTLFYLNVQHSSCT